jgi:protein-disulfide isomerase
MAKPNKNNSNDVIEINLKEYMTPIALIFGSILISVTLLVSLLSINSNIKKLGKGDIAGTNTNTNTDTTGTDNTGTTPTTGKTTIDDDPIMGNKDKAKIAIVEFSDFECPFCKTFQQNTFSQIKKDYIDTNKAIFVYRDYPLSFHEPNATDEANAATCVFKMGGTDKFWKFHDLIYKNTPSNKGLQKSSLYEYAAQVGVNKDEFKSCLDNLKYKDESVKDETDGANAGVDGTPGFIIGVLDKDGNVSGELISGAQPYDTFKAAIERQLAAAK